MDLGLRRLVLPANQRRSLEDLTEDLDLRSGDRRAKQTAFWTMLALSAVIATAGVLADSTATVIGAMIIAPLSTPIMGIALGIVKRERLRAGRFVLLGALAVVLIGYAFTVVVPGTIDLQGNGQVTGRTSPGLLDLVAAIATGLAGAVALSRRDVAAVLPGVAIAISLVPPLAVVGVCLGEGDLLAAFGALLLFVSNLIALVLAGTILFAALGYSAEANHQLARRVGAGAKGYLVLGSLLLLVVLLLAANTGLVYLVHWYGAQVESAAHRWVAVVPGAEVTSVDSSSSGFVVNVRSPQELPPVDRLLDDLAGDLPPFLPITVDVTFGRSLDAGVVPDAPG